MKTNWLTLIEKNLITLKQIEFNSNTYIEKEPELVKIIDFFSDIIEDNGSVYVAAKKNIIGNIEIYCKNGSHPIKGKIIIVKDDGLIVLYIYSYHTSPSDEFIKFRQSNILWDNIEMIEFNYMKLFKVDAIK